MILIALAAAVQVPENWESQCNKPNWHCFFGNSSTVQCKSDDIPCLEKDLERKIKVQAQEKARYEEYHRYDKICGEFDRNPHGFLPQTGWSEVNAARSRLCRARMVAKEKR